jgi:tetratricopeptide (TPR) repeat protein
LIVFDADDRLVGNFKLPVTMKDDSYSMKFGKTFLWTRFVIINNRKRWHFKGVLHEIIEALEPTKDNVLITGDYYINPGHGGDRSKAINNYSNDAIILEKAFDLEGSEGLKNRYAFYCAQSYRDANNIDKAIEWYTVCLTRNNWIQEQWCSCYNIGCLYEQQNNMPEAIKYWLKTVEFDPDRIEGIVNVCEYYRQIECHLLVNLLYHRFKGYKKDLTDKLFLCADKYDDVLEYNNSICAYYVGDNKSGYACCKQILTNGIATDTIIKNARTNIKFYNET